jgi:glyoxylase-like metal-dependent hydrolase (beta-lactamase superfamily II)
LNELAPGIFHWTAVHPNLGQDVSSYYVADAGTLIDPLTPEEGVEWFDGDRRPQRAVLTNRHHLRHSERFAASYAVPITCHQAGLHEFSDGPNVKPFSWGDELGPGITALKVDAICDEETALRIDIGDGFLVVADAVINYGELGFVPDQYIGDDPDAVKAAIKEALRPLLDEPFDSILPAHGKPIVGGGKEALRRFVEFDRSSP